MDDFTESTTLDGVQFCLTQREDTGIEVLLLGVLGGVYGLPVVGIVVIAALGLEFSRVAITAVVSLVGLTIVLAAAAIVTRRLRERRQVTLEVGRGGLVLNGTKLSLVNTTVVLQRLAFTDRSVLVLDGSHTDQPEHLGGLVLTAAQHARIVSVLDDARRDAEGRGGGCVPEALQTLREKSPPGRMAESPQHSESSPLNAL